MKKIFSVLFISVLSLFILAGCGNKDLKTTVLKGTSTTLEIGLPYELKDEAAPNYGDLKKYVLNSYHKIGTGDNSIHISCIMFDENKLKQDRGNDYKPDLNRVVHGSINGMSKNKNFSNFKLDKIEDITLNGIEAKEFGASYTIDSKGKSQDFEVDAILFIKGQDLWNIYIITPKDEDDSKELSNKMRASLVVK